MSLTEKEMKWDKLDNTALLFPVIANESMSSVYRISVTLTEDIIEEKLQEALSRVLPKFDVFHVRLRRGLFWYYLKQITDQRRKCGKKIPIHACIFRCIRTTIICFV